MGLCNVECVQRIAQYLNISPGKLEICNKNVSIAANLISVWNVFHVYVKFNCYFFTVKLFFARDQTKN